MNIKELNETLKNILNELADSSKDLKNLIRNWTPNIFRHIYLIQNYGKLYPKTKHHWASEIAGSMAKFCFKKVRYSNKQMSNKYIYTAMLSKFVDSDEIVDIIYDCLDKYSGIQLEDLDIDGCYNRIITILPNLITYCKANRKMDLDEIIKIVG